MRASRASWPCRALLAAGSIALSRLTRRTKPPVVIALALLSWLGNAVMAASEPELAPRPKRLVLLLDGTENGPEQDVDSSYGYKLYKPTNVLKTYRAIRAVDEGVDQVAYYSEGVGSEIGQPTPFSGLGVFVDRFLGGLFAFGYEPRVKDAYRFLVANYKPGDQIFVFGFSRGAAEAQTLVRFIAWIGGVLPDKDLGGILKKQDEYYIPELYDGFRGSQIKPYSHSNQGKAQEVFDRIRARRCTSERSGGPVELAQCRQRAIGDPVGAQIDVLGVYETVVSVGSRLAPDGSVTTVAERYAYLVDRIPPKIVKTIRQALSVDEARWDFRPQVWQPDDDSLAKSGALMQRWFPGVHSNVGGGFRYDELANHALGWLLDKTNLRAELGLDPDYMIHFLRSSECADASRPNSDTAVYKFAELIRFKSGRGIRKLATWDKAGSWERSGLGFHESLGRLLIDDCTYRPQNLLEFLAQHPQRIAEFPASQQGDIRQIVELSRGGKRSPKPYYLCRPPVDCTAAAPAAH